MKRNAPFRIGLNVRQFRDCPICARMIEQLDRSIGIVLAKLDEHGLDKNTIIALPQIMVGFIRDAYAASNLPFVVAREDNGKGIRNPFILKLPAYRAVHLFHSSWRDRLVPHPLNSVKSRSQKQNGRRHLVPLLQDKEINEGPVLALSALRKSGRGAQFNDYGRRLKLIHYHEDGHDELYNLK